MNMPRRIYPWVGMGLGSWWIWCAAIGCGRFLLACSSEKHFTAAMATPALSLLPSTIVTAHSSSSSSSSSICAPITSRRNISIPAIGFWEVQKTPCGGNRSRSSSFSVECAPESRVAERTPVMSQINASLGYL